MFIVDISVDFCSDVMGCDKSSELRRWEIRKMKTAGMRIREEYSDEEAEEVLELVYMGGVPGFLGEECGATFRNDIAIEKTDSEMSRIAKRRSVFLDTHARGGGVVTIGGEVDKASSEGLPIHKFREELMGFVERQQVAVLVGETGSGKSTQVPQYLYQMGYGDRGMIGCTQPRRMAAINLWRTVRKTLGPRVGYTVRFDDRTTAETRVKYMTEGILLQELLCDGLLSRYSVVILDEAHDRGVNLDVLMGLMKPVLKRRSDLRLIIMSATIQTEKFCSFFKCPSFSIEGRMHPVRIEYLRVNVDDYVEWAVKRVLHIHNECDEGDILVFGTGREDVEGMVGILSHLHGESTADGETEVPRSGLCLKLLPLYSQLCREQQDEVFKREEGTRKCIVSTNIAEASLTIPNIRYVVDCGLQKVSVYDYNSGESLVTVPISRASAGQRAGRAGRTRPGVCYRMYTEDTYNNELLESPVPEIQRVNVCSVVLLLLRQNVRDVVNFDLIDRPSPGLVRSALLLLYRLDAVDSEGCMTRTGEMLSELKLDLPLAKMVYESTRYGCTDEILSISSMVSAGEIYHRDFDRTSGICNPGCDFLTLLNIFNEFVRQGNRSRWCRDMKLSMRALEKAVETRNVTSAILARRGIEITRAGSLETVQRCIVSSLYYNIARRRNNGYVCLSNFAVCRIHPSSVLREPGDYVVFYKYMVTKTEYIYCCSAADPGMILMEAGRYYRDRRNSGGPRGDRVQCVEKSADANRSGAPRDQILLQDSCSKIASRVGSLEGNLYDRFEKWEHSSSSEEEPGPVKRNKRPRI